MKKKLKSLMLAGLCGLSLVATPILGLLPVFINNGNQSMPYKFGDKTFRTREDLYKYVKRNYGVSSSSNVSQSYYYISNDAAKKFISDSQLKSINDFVEENSIGTQVYSDYANVVKNMIDSSTGEIDPSWYEQAKVTDSNAVRIYRKSDNTVTTSSSAALDSYINSGYHAYYFNDIYFQSKSDLEFYLLNTYFDEIEDTGIKTLRIKGPNGEFSKPINIKSKSDWKSDAVNFIYENAKKVVAIQSRDSTIKYVNENNLQNEIDGEDVPYFKVKANDGRQSWVVGLNTEDNYELSGPTIYSGYTNVANFNEPSKWTKSNETFVSDYYDALNISNANAISTFIDQFMLSSASTTLGLDTSTDGLMFVEAKVDATLPYYNYETYSYEKSLVESRKIEFELEDETISTGKSSIELELGDLVNDREAIRNSTISQLSKNLIEKYQEAGFGYIYAEVQDAMQEYRNLMDANFILGLPIAYYLLMDRLMSAGANNNLLEATRVYFETIADTITYILRFELGEDALSSPLGYENLDLANLFGFDSYTIDFDISRFNTIITTNYPFLGASCSVASWVRLNKGIAGLSQKAIDVKINEMIDTFFSESSYAATARRVLRNVINIQKSKKSILKNKSVTRLASNDLAAFAAMKMIAVDENDTSLRDGVLDRVIDEAGELMNSSTSWNYVPNDNRFKIMAYYIQEKNNVKILPSDMLKNVNPFERTNLLAWNSAFVQLEYNLTNDDSYNKMANLLAEKAFVLGVNKNIASSDAIYDYELENIKAVNDNFISLNYEEDSIAKINPKIFNGAYLTFDEFKAITIMRMLGDVAAKDTLFKYDENLQTVMIADEYKAQATSVINDIENQPLLLRHLGFLYRGFQGIQEQIAAWSDLMVYKSDSDVSLPASIIVQIFQHIAQYSAAVNQNMEYLQSKLSAMGVQSKTGRVTAFSGTNTNLYLNGSNDKSYNFDFGENERIFSSDGEIITDLNSLFNDKNDTSSGCYVTPDVNINNGDISDFTFPQQIFFMPVELSDLDILNKYEYSLNKYVDMNQLTSIGLKQDDSEEIGPKFFFDVNARFDNPELIKSDKYDYYKKWGSAYAANTEDDGLNQLNSNQSSELEPAVNSIISPYETQFVDADHPDQFVSTRPATKPVDATGQTVEDVVWNEKNSVWEQVNEYGEVCQWRLSTDNKWYLTQQLNFDGSKNFVWRNYGADGWEWLTFEGDKQYIRQSKYSWLNNEDENEILCPNFGADVNYYSTPKSKIANWVETDFDSEYVDEVLGQVVNPEAKVKTASINVNTKSDLMTPGGISADYSDLLNDTIASQIIFSEHRNEMVSLADVLKNATQEINDHSIVWSSTVRNGPDTFDVYVTKTIAIDAINNRPFVTYIVETTKDIFENDILFFRGSNGKRWYSLDSYNSLKGFKGITWDTTEGWIIKSAKITKSDFAYKMFYDDKDILSAASDHLQSRIRYRGGVSSVDSFDFSDVDFPDCGLKPAGSFQSEYISTEVNDVTLDKRKIEEQKEFVAKDESVDVDDTKRFSEKLSVDAPTSADSNIINTTNNLAVQAQENAAVTVATLGDQNQTKVSANFGDSLRSSSERTRVTSDETMNVVSDAHRTDATFSSVVPDIQTSVGGNIVATNKVNVWDIVKQSVNQSNALELLSTYLNLTGLGNTYSSFYYSSFDTVDQFLEEFFDSTSDAVFKGGSRMKWILAVNDYQLYADFTNSALYSKYIEWSADADNVGRKFNFAQYATPEDNALIDKMWSYISQNKYANVTVQESLSEVITRNWDYLSNQYGHESSIKRILGDFVNVNENITFAPTDFSMYLKDKSPNASTYQFADLSKISDDDFVKNIAMSHALRSCDELQLYKNYEILSNNLQLSGLTIEQENKLVNDILIIDSRLFESQSNALEEMNRIQAVLNTIDDVDSDEYLALQRRADVLKRYYDESRLITHKSEHINKSRNDLIDFKYAQNFYRADANVNVVNTTNATVLDTNSTARTAAANFEEARATIESLFQNLDAQAEQLKRKVTNAQQNLTVKIDAPKTADVDNAFKAVSSVNKVGVTAAGGATADVMTELGHVLNGTSVVSEVLNNVNGVDASAANNDLAEAVRKEAKSVTDSVVQTSLPSGDNPSKDAVTLNEINNTRNPKAKKTKFKKLFKCLSLVTGVLNTAMVIASTAMMIYSMVQMFKMIQYQCVYTFKTTDAEWTWSGGLYEQNQIGQSNELRTPSDMKTINPIKVNNSYLRDFIYYNGMFSDDNYGREQARLAFIEDIKLAKAANVLNLYTFDDTIDSSTSLYTSKEYLANAVLDDIENNDDSQYVSDKVVSFSDGYLGSIASLDSVEAVTAAAKRISNNIRATYYSLNPILVNNKLYDRRENYCLPGNSYDARRNRVITVNDKKNMYPEFSNNWYQIDNSANNLMENNYNDFALSKVEAEARSRERLNDAVKQRFENKLDYLMAYNTQGSDILSKTYSEIKDNVLSDFGLHEVVEYRVRDNEVHYFVATYDTSGKLIGTAWDNLMSYVLKTFNIHTETVKNDVTLYRTSDGTYQTSNIDEFITYVNLWS